jgi:hypothetical protein
MSVDPNQLLSLKTSDKNRLTEDSIASIVSHYKNGKTGTGLIFVIDNFDKPAAEGVMYVTFFDTATGKMLWTKKLKGAPGGFGIRNYWARSVYNVLEKCKEHYSSWQKQAGK